MEQASEHLSEFADDTCGNETGSRVDIGDLTAEGDDPDEEKESEYILEELMVSDQKVPSDGEEIPDLL